MVRSTRPAVTSKAHSKIAGLQPIESLNNKGLRTIAELVHKHSGIVHQPRNYPALVRAVTSRMANLGIATTSDYLNRINRLGKQNELTELTALLTIQKTSFFRDRSQFELLEEKVLEDIIHRKSTIPPELKVWSAGCSTGEEPYSIAIALSRSWPYKNTTYLLATDISVCALGQALQGNYQKSDLVPLKDSENRYFYKKDDLWHISENIRSMVDFKFHNLVSFPFPAPKQGLWDIIFCRNVLIYFNRETVKEIISRFRQVLSPHGYLFLGPSESLYRLAEGFDLVYTENAFVYQKSETKSALSADRIPDLKSSSTSIGSPGTSIIAGSINAPTGKNSTLAIPQAYPNADYRSAKKLPGSTEDLAEALRSAKELLENGDSQTAFTNLLQICKQHPQTRLPYVILGKIAADRGSLEEALSWFQLATKIDPLDIESRFLLAVVLHRIGQDQEAVEELRKVIFLDGQFVLGHYYLGVVAMHLKEEETALRSFRNVLRSTDAGLNQTACDIMNTLHLTLDTLQSASQAYLKRHEGKSSRSRSRRL